MFMQPYASHRSKLGQFLLLYKSWYYFNRACTTQASRDTASNLIDTAWHNSEYVDLLKLSTVHGEFETNKFMSQS